MLDEVGYYAACVGIFLRTMVDKHYCGGFLCLMWRVIVLDVVVFFVCFDKEALLWWVIMLDVVVYYALLLNVDDIFACCGG